MAIGRTNAGSGGGLNKSILIVSAPTGATLTATLGDTVKTASEKTPGEYWLRNLDVGEWNLKLTLGEQSATAKYNIERFGVYRTSMAFHTIMEFTYTGDYEIVQDDDTPIDDFSQWNGNWKIRFLTSGVFTVTKFHNFDGTIDVFLVGAGGVGAHGGGGSGYTKTGMGINLVKDTRYEITVAGSVKSGQGGTTTAFSLAAKGGLASGQENEGGNGGSGGGTWKSPGGKDGEDGSKNGDGSPGKGQGSTTREFGDPEGRLYATGGSGADYSSPTDRSPNTGNGGNGNDSGQNVESSSGIVVIRNAREVA